MQGGREMNESRDNVITIDHGAALQWWDADAQRIVNTLFGATQYTMSDAALAVRDLKAKHPGVKFETEPLLVAGRRLAACVDGDKRKGGQ